MPKYLIQNPEVVVFQYVVDADNAADAIRKMKDGKVDMSQGGVIEEIDPFPKAYEEFIKVLEMRWIDHKLIKKGNVVKFPVEQIE